MRNTLIGLTLLSLGAGFRHVGAHQLGQGNHAHSLPDKKARGFIQRLQKPDAGSNKKQHGIVR